MFNNENLLISILIIIYSFYYTLHNLSYIYHEYLDQENVAIDGVLLIIENPEALKPLLKILSNNDNVQKPLVVYIIFVGLRLWELPKSDFLKMVVMQEAA